MIVESESNVKSGPGTSMFSRSGASTIVLHKIFSSKFDDIDEFVADAREKKTFKKAGLADGDNAALSGDISSRLPAISENEENQSIVQVPGLAAELNKLDKHYRQIKEDKEKGKQ